MSKKSHWVDGTRAVQSILQQAHNDRHNSGRNQTKQRLAEIEALREAGNQERIRQLEERASKRSVQFMRYKRQAEEREAEQELKKLGAVLRREERRLSKKQPSTASFMQFEAEERSKSRDLRDLYHEWIPRGLSSGTERNYSRPKKRSTARTTPWTKGEMGKKIRYIFREDALEEVEGNMLQNMGDDIAEAVACSGLIEELERIGRDSNGGVYRHVILALPHQLSGSERAELLRELTQPLRNLKLPFCAALHKPDARGDQRNFHAHIVLSLRPMERLGEYQWEFFPSKRTWIETPAGLHLQRRFVARSFNRALARAGLEVRWTAKSRRDRGEQSPGNTKKGPERTRQERQARAAHENSMTTRASFFDVSADLRAVSKLEEAEAVMEEAAGPLRSITDRSVRELRDLASACSVAAKGLRTDGARLGRLVQPLEQAEENQAALPPPAVTAEAPAEFPIEEMDAPKKKRRSSAWMGLDAAGTARMNDVIGEAPEEEALERLRGAVLAGRLHSLKREQGRYELLADDRAILRDAINIIQTEKGQAYLREVVDGLPSPPAHLEPGSGMKLTYKELLEDEELSVEVQDAWLRGGGQQI